MAKLSRFTQKLFGISAGFHQIGKFGSLFAGAAQYTTDPGEAMSLSNWQDGWYSAAIGGNAPAIQDMNAACFVFAYQLGYLCQAGVAEWDAGTTYYIGSLAQDGFGNVYSSLTDNNLNHALTDTANWKLPGGATRTVSTTAIVAQTDDMIRADANLASFNVTLPAVASTPVGKVFTIKRINAGSNTVTVKGNGSETIDGSNTYVLDSPVGYDSVDVRNNGTTWDII